MRINRHIVNLTEPEKAQFEDYLEKKVDRIRPLIEAHFPDVDTVKLAARIQKHDKHTAFEFQYELDMPRKRIVSSEVKHSITESLDLATDRLENGLREHFKRLIKK